MKKIFTKLKYGIAEDILVFQKHKAFGKKLSKIMAKNRINTSQNCHKRIEKFLREIRIEPAESTSRNPLEQVWSLTAEEFTRRVGVDGLKAYQSTREETMSATEEIVRVEGEIDERVKGLYGV